MTPGCACAATEPTPMRRRPPIASLSSAIALPAYYRTIGKTVRSITRAPRSPRTPVPSRVGIHRGGHLLFIGQILLQLVRLVLVVCLLRPDVQTAAHEGVG